MAGIKKNQAIRPEKTGNPSVIKGLETEWQLRQVASGKATPAKPLDTPATATAKVATHIADVKSQQKTATGEGGQERVGEQVGEGD